MTNQTETRLDPIIVPQAHGADTTVDVFATTQPGPIGPVQQLHFHSPQSLKSQSARAWNVKEAIRKYCFERGYQIAHEDQRTITATYSAHAHSGYARNQLVTALRADPRYTAECRRAREAQDAVGHKFAPALEQLHNLVRALEEKAKEEGERIQKETAQVRAAILAEMELPPHLLPEDLQRLEQYGPGDCTTGVTLNRRTKELPTDLQPILNLLKD